MRGPSQAIIAVCLFAALSVWVAPLGIFAGAIIALVTLRVSVIEGFKTLVWGVTAHVLLSVMLSGSYWPALISVLEYMFPVWLMSVVLRQTSSLASALQAAMVMAGLGVIGFYLMVPEPAQWWLALFNQHREQTGAPCEFHADPIRYRAAALFPLTLLFRIVPICSIQYRP